MALKALKAAEPLEQNAMHKNSNNVLKVNPESLKSD
jgi:hypothetical protein